MSYNLRPERKLKRPARYKSDSGDESENSPKSTDQDMTADITPGLSSHQSTSAVAHDTLCQSPCAPLTMSVVSAAYKPSSTPRILLDTDTTSKQDSKPKMPTIKFINMNSEGKIVDMDRDGAVDDNQIRTSARQARKKPVQLDSQFLHPAAKPAAFPSFQDYCPPLEKHTEDGWEYSVKMLVEALEKNDHTNIQRIQSRIEQMYSNEEFPPDIDEEAKAWYIGVAKQLGPQKGLEQRIPFRSLWPSLRQTIIEKIRDEFPKGTYHDPYDPVRRVLRLEQPALEAIMAENRKPWYTEDEIPQHLRNAKRLNPDMAVDPDEPPENELGNAIKFLRQEHLQASLLGEWRGPIPSRKGFHVTSKVTMISNFDYGTSLVYSNKREHPDVLKPKETLALLLRCGWKPLQSSYNASSTSDDVFQRYINLQTAVQAEVQTQVRQNRLLVRRFRRAIAQRRAFAPEQRRSSDQVRKLPLTHSPVRIRKQGRGMKNNVFRNTNGSSVFHDYAASADGAGLSLLAQAHDTELATTPKRPLFNAIENGISGDPASQATNSTTRLQTRPQSDLHSMGMATELQIPIRTIEELEQKNRAHPGLQPYTPTISRIREDLRTSEPQYVFTERSHSKELSQAECFDAYYPTDMTASSAAYAQATTMNAVLRRAQVSAYEAVVRDDLDHGPPPYPKVPILCRVESYERSMLDLMENIISDTPLPDDSSQTRQ
ncbi:hypothetical protein BKA66DRAFT_598377 [Pyrenochaeta sp. MPI-SDFR-AT-0127]|nr:hypothetical protein BKA66DRAFT_598377 [Pyrenochaeta sp. MPI-SDFR-AT-0127]